MIQPGILNNKPKDSGAVTETTVYNELKWSYNSQQIPAVHVFKGHNSECDLQQGIMLFDVSWLMYVRYLVHMQKEESKVNIAGAA